MDWSTALFTAGLSAAVSSVVSLLAVSTVTTRQERAKRRETARIQLSDAVRPIQHQLARYTFAAEQSAAEFPGRTMRDEGGPVETRDFDDVIAIIRAVEPLPWWRKALINRRLRKIWGNGLVEIVRDYPVTSDKPGEAGFAIWMRTSVAGVEWKDSPTDALLHRTFAKPPSPYVGKALARQLNLLAKGL
jgi:hypothetical protein